jgi:hypothetical protein
MFVDFTLGKDLGFWIKTRQWQVPHPLNMADPAKTLASTLQGQQGIRRTLDQTLPTGSVSPQAANSSQEEVRLELLAIIIR